MTDGNGNKAARLPIRISMDDPEPMYRQIEEQLRDLILRGQLPAGTPLPSIRALTRDLACSVITTRRAYQDLENEGLIRTRQGMGTVVAELGEEKKENFRREAVFEAFGQAIETGRRVGCADGELREIFDAVLRERNGE